VTIFARTFGKAARVAVAAAAICISSSGAALAQDSHPSRGFVNLDEALKTAMKRALAESVATAASPEGAEEAQAAGAAMSFFEGTELFGLVDTYYDWYSTKPTGDAPLRNFDTKHNQFALSLIEVGLGKAPTADSRAGFRVDLDYGPTAALVTAFEPGGLGVFQNIQQAYVSYLAPAGNGLQFDVGKFVTQHGAEVIEAKDNWNYSRSLMFALAIPYYHMGVRATYAVNDKVTLAGVLVNGWNNVVENNDGKTVGVQLILKPTGAVSIVQNVMTGPEQAGNDDDWRTLSDTLVTFTATPKLSLMANYDYGKDTVAGQSVKWQGLAGYLKFQATEECAIIPRFEWYQDDDGFTTGAAQTLKDFTLTGEMKLTPALIWRLEYRGDFSDVDFYTKKSGARSKNQQSIGFGLLYSFSSKS
jgi:hypothetical protein